MPSSSDVPRLRYLRLVAADVSACYEDARGRGICKPVVFVVDLEDSLGQRLAEHYKLRDPLSFLALPLEEALTWLGGERAPLVLAEALHDDAPRMLTVLVAGDTASVHSVEL